MSNLDTPGPFSNVREYLALLHETGSMPEFRIQADIRGLKQAEQILAHYGWDGNFEKFKENTEYDIGVLCWLEFCPRLVVEPAKNDGKWLCSPRSNKTNINFFTKEYSLDEVKAYIRWLGIEREKLAAGGKQNRKEKKKLLLELLKA